MAPQRPRDNMHTRQGVCSAYASRLCATPVCREVVGHSCLPMTRGARSHVSTALAPGGRLL
eukprot:15444857-Alexandrium_andersonii.AAC.1